MRRLLTIVGCSLLVLTSFCLGHSVVAQEAYPTRPITVLIPSEAGSGADIMFRKMSPKLQKHWENL